MAIIGVFCLIISPVLFGTFIATVLKEKSFKLVEKYSLGLIFLFTLFFLCLLIALKKDFTLEKLGNVFSVFFMLFFVISIPAFIASVKKENFSSHTLSRGAMLVIISGIFLALYSFVFLAPSFLNDDTWEIVSTSIAHNSIYEYSSMTGRKMINGLPIFNKIYVMPMFYSVLCGKLDIPLWVIAGFVNPILVYVLNILLIYEIGKAVNVYDIKRFMVFYMILLIGGTYLTEKGIPVTAGYALLREGYSGYAIAYGVVIPLGILLFLKKKPVLSALTLLSLVMFIRLDRIYYAAITPFKAYQNINRSGKMLALYIICVFIYVGLAVSKRERIKPILLIVPEVLISYIAISILKYIPCKRRKATYLVAISLIALSICSFEPFKDAENLSDVLNYEKEVKDRIRELELSGKIIWASEDFMETARRVDGTVCTLYGRDTVSSILDGVDYEVKSEYAWDYYNSYKNMHASNPAFYPSKLSVEDAIVKAYEEGMDVLVE